MTGDKTTAEVNALITQHDHIIMMGHGTPQGLLSVGQFNKPKVNPTKQKPKPKTKPVVSSQPGKPWSKEDQKALSLLDDLDEDDWFADRKVGGGGYYSTYRPSQSYVSNYVSGYIINDDTVPILRGKKLTAIWCNADQFMEWNGLGGFYTGMFISETSEAKLIGTAGADQWQVDESNYGFVSVVRRFITQPAERLLAALKLEYGKMSEYNPVARYNYRRLYVGEESNVRMEREEAEITRIASRESGDPSDRADGRTPVIAGEKRRADGS